MDRGAWWTANGVTKSLMQVSDPHFPFHVLSCWKHSWRHWDRGSEWDRWKSLLPGRVLTIQSGEGSINSAQKASVGERD